MSQLALLWVVVQAKLVQAKRRQCSQFFHILPMNCFCDSFSYHHGSMLRNLQARDFAGLGNGNFLFKRPFFFETAGMHSQK